MTLQPYLADRVLTGQAIPIWESVTANHVRQYIMNEAPQLQDLKVKSNIVSQSLAKASGRRRLQGTNRPLTVQFDVDVSFRSTSSVQDVPSLIFSAWKSPTDRAAYILALQNGSSVFNDIQDVSVQVQGYIPPPASGSGKSVNVGVIAGAAVGGAVVVFLIAFFGLRGRIAKEDPNQNSITSPETTNQKIAVSA